MDKWFFDQARRGNVYHSADTAAITLTALNATCTGCILHNPPTSSKWLVVKDFRFVPNSDPGLNTVTVEVQPAVSSTALTGTTANTIENAIMQGSDVGVGVGECYQAATLPAAPIRLFPVSQYGVEAASVSGTGVIELNGSLILPAGMTANLGFLTNASVGVGSVTWAEVDPY